MAETSIVQARVAEELLKQLDADARVLGIESTSDAIRAGLDLLHRQAVQVQLARSYDDFYGGEPAPLSEVTAALWGITD
jgi:hypothetical protein